MSITLPLHDPYHLKLSTKKLSGGKFQVKFHATLKERRPLYGYLFVEANDSLKNVVNEIRSELNFIVQSRNITSFSAPAQRHVPLLNPNILIVN